jgi:N-acylglucosamine 2-epimerase
MSVEERALHETVGPEGQRLDSPEGRLVNPGHAIEVAWFLMHEARQRGDQALLAQAIDILEWSLQWGWDEVHGGLLYFVDLEGRPPEQLEWDMKLWWPHTEALYATLLAYQLTGAERWATWHERIRAWAFERFSDPEHGEWFGYLHRDGSVSLPAKGSMWKGAFHLPRAMWLCWRLAEDMLASPREAGRS